MVQRGEEGPLEGSQYDIMERKLNLEPENFGLLPGSVLFTISMIMGKSYYLHGPWFTYL